MSHCHNINAWTIYQRKLHIVELLPLLSQNIISTDLSQLPQAAGRADMVCDCMFTLQHVDCVGIGMQWASRLWHTDFLSPRIAYTQAISLFVHVGLE